jgi:hypothetical protein
MTTLVKCMSLLKVQVIYFSGNFKSFSFDEISTAVDSEIMSIKEKLIDGLTASFVIIQQNRLEVCDSETCVNRCKEKTEGEKAFAAAAAANYVAAQINRQLSEMPAGEDTEKSEANQPDGKQSVCSPAGEEMEREAAQVANLIAETGKTELEREEAANQPDGKQSGCSLSGEEMKREAAQVANLIAVTGKTELEREEAANQPDGKPRHNHIYVCL